MSVDSVEIGINVDHSAHQNRQSESRDSDHDNMRKIQMKLNLRLGIPYRKDCIARKVKVAATIFDGTRDPWV